MNDNKTLEKQIEDLGFKGHESPGQMLSEYRTYNFAHIALYGVASLTISLMFHGSWVSPDWVGIVFDSSSPFQRKVEAVMWLFVAVLFVLSITVAALLAHRSNMNKTRIAIWVVLLTVSYNYWTETASSMQRADDRVIYMSGASTQHKDASEAASRSYVSDPRTVKLQEHVAENRAELNHWVKKRNQQQIEKWSKLLKKRESELKAHLANVEVEKTSNAQRAADTEHNTTFTHMIIKLAMEHFSMGYATAAFVVTSFFIIVFEVCGFWLGREVKRYRDALPLYGVNLYHKADIKHELHEQDINVKADEDRLKNERREHVNDLKRHTVEGRASRVAENLNNEFKKRGNYGASPAAGADVASEPNARNSNHTASSNSDHTADDEPLQNAGSERDTAVSNHTTSGMKPYRKKTSGKRTTGTADTEVTGKNSKRYKAVKQAVLRGTINPTQRGIRKFIYGGKGMGVGTAKKYHDQLKKDGVIK